MNKQKQVPNVKLQKTSVIFMQLGLILALFIVYQIIEHESFYKPIEFADNNDPVVIDEPTIKEFDIERTKPKSKNVEPVEKVIPKQEPKAAETFETVKDTDKKIEETVLATTDIDPDKTLIPALTVSDITEVPDEEDLEPLPFNKIEVAPGFPGCKGTNAEMKQCFNDKVNKFVQRKFNANIAQEIGLSEGMKRINVQFVVNKKGEIVDIKVRAPHKRLEKEARRVIKLLPKMKPAKQGTGSANVRFGLPILFKVES